MTEEIRLKHFGEEWSRRLEGLLTSPEFDALGRFLSANRKHLTIYPSNDLMFKAFRETPFSKVRVVILGQDPYHDGSATGLAFANDNSTIVPSPSLRNILIEVENDVYGGYDLECSINFDLTPWAHQGVLLLNTALTVVKGHPGSHTKKWHFFTETVIRTLAASGNSIIWLLWGKHAQSYKHLIMPSTNHILECGHPVTPTYGRDMWFGNKHFSKTNELLKSMNGDGAIIKW